MIFIGLDTKVKTRIYFESFLFYF